MNADVTWIYVVITALIGYRHHNREAYYDIFSISPAIVTLYVLPLYCKVLGMLQIVQQSLISVCYMRT